MFLKKVLNQPNLAGTVMIALLVSAGFVYAFAFDGFNVQTATQANGGGPASSYTCDNDCSYILCPAKKKNTGDCSGCSKVKYCTSGCSKNHSCSNSAGCPHLHSGASGGCSNYSSQRSCPSGCRGKT